MIQINVYIFSLQMIRWFLILLVIVSIWACPRKCRCSLDEKGRRRVQCEEGGMKDQIPIQGMALDTEVLVITAPLYRPNSLNLGPIFRKLKLLEEIHITWSGVPAIGAHSFWGLRNLRVLNLTHNSLSILMDTNFKGAEALKQLDLSHNMIESVPSAVFRYVNQLRTLSLAYNTIPELVPRVLFGLTRLEELDISNNPLGDLLPERFSDVPELKVLGCAGCGIMSISSSLLEALQKLRVFDLRNNRLTQIPHRISILPQLTKLQLDGNHISFIEKNIISQSKISRLHLSHNRIIRIEAGAFSNTSLAYLDLSYNRFAHLEPGSLDDVLVQLLDLRLSGNSLHIDELKTIIPKSRHLRHLGLGNMGLTRIPHDFLNHSNHLHHLNVSGNYLKTFPLTILKSTPHLKVLDISLNSFRGLEEDLVEQFTISKELRMIKLEGNPWHCDRCHVLPLLTWLHGAPDQESGCSEKRVWTCLKCSGPDSLNGQVLSLLPPGDLPACPSAAPARPTWVPQPSLHVNNNEVIDSQRDEPVFPRGDFSRKETGVSVVQFIKEKLLLFIMVGCALTLLLIMVIVMGIVVYHKRSAYYYTYENDPDKRQRLVRLFEMKNNNSPKSKTKIALKVRQDPSIATIDELTNIAGSQEIVDNGLESIRQLDSEPRPGTT